MAWDFSTEPEFEHQLDWMRTFVRDNPTAGNLYALALGAEYAHTRFQHARGGR